MSLIRAARLFSGALALAVLVACPESTPPVPTVEKEIEIDNVFANPSSDAAARMARANRAEGAIQITKIRLTVYESPSNKVLFQQVFDVDPTKTKWTLPFTAPVGATVKITSELISVTSGVEKVEYSGKTEPIVLQPCTTTCTPIPIQNYPGPLENFEATGISISPDGASVVEGSTTNLTATITSSGGTYTPSWRSLNTPVATVSSTGVVTGVAVGTAQIVANVGSHADTVNITVTPLNTCAEVAYTVGTSVNAAWTAGDCLAASGSGRHYDQYAFTLAAQTSFTAAITGPAGRRVNVRRAGTQDYVQLMASEAFMPAAQNPLQVGLILPAGSYVMEIATPDAATLGAYSLATTLGLSASCEVLNYIWYPATVNGSIANTDCAGPGGVGREDRFIMLPSAGVRFGMAVSTTAFAPIVLYRDDRLGAASPPLAYDFQSEVGQTARLAYTTTFDGFTEIIVSSYNPAGTGNYTLSLTTENTANTCVGLTTDITKRMGWFESTDCAETGRVYDKFPFTVTEQTAFKVTLAGAAATKSAGVYKNNVEVLDWQNAGTADLTAAWLLEPGTYEFRVGAPTANAGTSYVVTASDITDVGCTNNGTSGNVTLPGQTLGGSDCTFSGAYEDRLVLFVAAGKTIDVTMNGSTVAPRAVIRDPGTPAGTTLVNNTRVDAGTVTASYAVTTTGYYQVIFSTNQPGQTGGYSGSIVIR